MSESSRDSRMRIEHLEAELRRLDPSMVIGDDAEFRVRLDAVIVYAGLAYAAGRDTGWMMVRDCLGAARLALTDIVERGDGD